MITQYVTSDKKVFEKKEDAQAHEDELTQAKAEREKLEQEKQSRKDEIKADYEALMKKIEKYNKDYNEPVKWASHSKSADIPLLTSFPFFWDLFDIFRR